MIIPSKSRDASARADYHAAERGYWLGAGAGALGLPEGGEVESLHLRRVLDGCHPATGKSLLQRRRKDRVACQEELICAPKSISLAALGRVEGVSSEAVQDAHRLGVGEAWAEMARLTRGRRAGSPSGCRVEMVAAAYEHTSSRADDPHLNTHLLIANLGLADPRDGESDRRWVALEKSTFCFHRAWLTAVYRNALARHLSARRIRWELTGNPPGAPELVAVSAEERLRHSTASQAIADYQEAHPGLPPALLALRRLRQREAKTHPEAQLPEASFLPPRPPDPNALRHLSPDAGERPGALGAMVRAVAATDLRRPCVGRATPPLTLEDLLWRGFRLAGAEQQGRDPASLSLDFLRATLQRYPGVAHLGTWRVALERAARRLARRHSAEAEEALLQRRFLSERRATVQFGLAPGPSPLPAREASAAMVVDPAPAAAQRDGSNDASRVRAQRQRLRLEYLGMTQDSGPGSGRRPGGGPKR